MPFSATQASTSIRPAQATLNGMAVANREESKAWFEWGLRGRLDRKTTVVSVGNGSGVRRVSAAVTGLQGQTVYECRLVVSNASGVKTGFPQFFTTGGQADFIPTYFYDLPVPPRAASNVVAVSAGHNFSVAVRNDGKVVAWGDGVPGDAWAGQTNVPGGLSNVVAVAAGGRHAVALRANGSVATWGGSPVITVPAGITNAVAVAAGWDYSLALLADGKVAAWGQGLPPEPLPSGLTNVVAVSAGYAHILALHADGTVTAWGSNVNGEAEVPASLGEVVAVCAGTYFSMALQADGKVTTWGDLEAPPAGLSNVVAIAGGGISYIWSSGYTTGCALQAGGQARFWGYQAAARNAEAELWPLVSALGASPYHFLALRNGPLQNVPPGAESQSVWAVLNRDVVIRLTASDRNKDPLRFALWTGPDRGVLYQYDQGGRGAVITATNALVSDPQGRVVYAAENGAQGANYASFKFVARDGWTESAPATVTIQAGVSQLFTREAWNLPPDRVALHGSVVAAGQPTSVWFEWGERNAALQATPVTNLTGGAELIPVEAVLEGLPPRRTYVCQLVASNVLGIRRGAKKVFNTGGKVFRWAAVDRPDPMPAGVEGVVALAAGDYRSLVIRRDGTLGYWTQAEGYPPASPGWIPAEIGGLSNFVAVATRSDYGLALQSDGRVKVWGDSFDNLTNLPYAVAQASNLVAVAAGSDHALALQSDGTVHAWGDDSYGQIAVPAGLDRVVAIAAAGNYSMALRIDGTTFLWGETNYYGINLGETFTNVVAMAARPSAPPVYLRGDGTLAGWNDVPPGSEVQAIAGTPMTALALLANGRLVDDDRSEDGLLPVGVVNVAQMAGGYDYILALVTGAPPEASPVNQLLSRHTDSVIVLGKTNVFEQTYRVVTLPTDGTLYQYDRGRRGAAITQRRTPVTDPAGRVIYGPAEGSRQPEAVFYFVAEAGGQTSAETLARLRFDEAGIFTLPATAIRQAEAVLHGATWNGEPLGGAWFEWGLQGQDYIHKVSVTNAAEATGFHRWQCRLTGLQPGRAYQYRLVVSNAVEVSRSHPHLFATGKAVQAYRRIGDDWGSSIRTAEFPVRANFTAFAGSAGLLCQTNGGVLTWHYEGDPPHFSADPEVNGLSNVVAASSLEGHQLALQADGTVQLWSSGDYTATAWPPAVLGEVAAVAEGSRHHVVLRTDGTLQVWPREEGVDRSVLEPPVLLPVVAVAAGDDFTLALQANGEVAVWGKNLAALPYVVPGLKDVVAIAAGSYFGIVLQKNGVVTEFFDDGSRYVLAGAEKVVAIASAGYSTLTLDQEGTARGWNGDWENWTVTNVTALAGGSDDVYVLTGEKPPQARNFSVVMGARQQPVLIQLGGAAQPSGWTYTISTLPKKGTLYQYAKGARGAAITARSRTVRDGRGRVWYVPGEGKAGNPFDTFAHTVNNGLGTSAPGVVTLEMQALPFTHPPTAVRTRQATLVGSLPARPLSTSAWFEWGIFGQFNHVTAPVTFPAGGLQRMQTVLTNLTAHRDYQCRLVTSNALGVCRGKTELFSTGREVATQEYVFEDNRVTALATCGGNRLYLLTDGTVFLEDQGLLSTRKNYADIAAGGQHLLAVRTDGRVDAWGSQEFDQTEIPAGLKQVMAVAAGAYHSLALRTNGTVVAWGNNEHGQTNVPAGLKQVVEIVAGGDISLALRADGTVVAWGNNQYGQTNVPADLQKVVRLAVTERRCLALRADGRVTTWGDNGAFPTNGIDSLENVLAISGGGSYSSLALRADGRAFLCPDRFDANPDPDFGSPALIPIFYGNGRVTRVAAGGDYFLALVQPVPTAQVQEVKTAANQPVAVTLEALPRESSEGETPAFWIRTLPKKGALYQYAGGKKGALITAVNTKVRDSFNRVLFVPARNGVGDPYASFSFVAAFSEGTKSLPATVRINVGSTLVFTLPPLRLDPQAVTLQGAVSADGLADRAWFEWGTFGQFNQVTAATNLPASGRLRRIQCPLTNLAANQNYQCRLVISNRTGISRGRPQLFTTGGKVKSWGYSKGNLLFDAGPTVAIASGGNNNLALQADGTVRGWEEVFPTPPDLENVTAIANSSSVNMAVQRDGLLRVWGERNVAVYTVPGDVVGLAVYAASDRNRDNAEVSGVVLHANGQVSLVENDGLQPFPGLSNIVTMSAGANGDFLVAVQMDGRVVWADADGVWPIRAPEGIMGVAAGYYDTALAFNANGAVYTLTPASWDGLPYIFNGAADAVAIAYIPNRSVVLQASGEIIDWRTEDGYPPVPDGFHRSVAVTLGAQHGLVLGENSVPSVSDQHYGLVAGQDVRITLAGRDADGDALRYRIVTLPATGTLYQSAPEGRGEAITRPDTLVADAAGQVLFAPDGSLPAEFTFVAGDGQTDSRPATVFISEGTVRLHTLAPFPAGPGAFVLRGAGEGSGLSGQVWFAWGRRGQPGGLTEVTNRTEAGGLVRYELPVTGLNPDTVYECRLVVSNTAGRHEAFPQTFTTGKAVVPWGEGGSAPAGLKPVVAVAAGYGHNLALQADGTAVAWDNGSSADLISVLPTNTVAIAAGRSHNLLLQRDGTMMAWQSYYYEDAIPEGFTNMVDIAAGDHHNLALRPDGTVVAWGDENYNVGQLDVPARLSNVVAIAAGELSSLALRVDGSVVAWGGGAGPSVPEGVTNVVAVSAGGGHFLALRADGTVVAWGRNDFGQTDLPAALGPVRAVAAGRNYSLALLADGQVVTWGYNLSPDSYYYTVTPLPTGLSNVCAIAAGTYHSLALGDSLHAPLAFDRTVAVAATRDTVISLTGEEEAGGPKYYEVTVLPDLGTLYQYAGGERGAAIVSVPAAVTDPQGRVIYDAGGNLDFPVVFSFRIRNAGLVSNPAFVRLELARPNLFTLPPTRAGVGAFTLHGVAAASELPGRVWLEWGPMGRFTEATASVETDLSRPWQRLDVGLTNLVAGNYQCRLAASNAAGTSYGLPQLFTTGQQVAYEAYAYPSGGTFLFNTDGFSNVVAVEMGRSLLALQADGTLFRMSAGDFGLITNAIVSVPPELDQVAAISSGGDYFMMLGANGRVEVQGDGISLGETHVPPGLENVVAISASDTHCLALRADGQVVSWIGRTNYYSNGNLHEVPEGLSNVVAVSAGDNYSLALLADGKVTTWGGGGTHTDVPEDLRPAVEVEASHYGSFALHVDGTVTAWTDYHGSFRYGFRSEVGRFARMTSLAASSGYVFGLQADGVVRLAGFDYRLTEEYPVTAIATWASYTARLVGEASLLSYPAPLRPQVVASRVGVIPPVLPSLDSTASGFAADGHFHLRFTGEPNARYRIWASTNLADWEVIGTVTAEETGLCEFTDEQAGTDSRRFYKLSTP